MYAVLGDADKQEKIRNANPLGEHCRILLNNPNGCMAYEGGICPNNPYIGQRKNQIDKLKAAYGDIEKKQSLASLLLSLPLDALASLPSFNTIQATIKRIIDQFKKEQEQENLAIRIGNRFIEIFNQMFKN